MPRNKKSGVAILSALILMNVVISFSFLIVAVMSTFGVSNKVSEKNLKNTTLIGQIYNDFIGNGQLDNAYNYDFDIAESENGDKKAVVVYKDKSKSVDNLLYLLAYNFKENKVIVSQKDNFYITKKEISGQTYLVIADEIVFKEV